MTQKLTLVVVLLLWTLGSLGLFTKSDSFPDSTTSASCPEGETCFGGFPDPKG